MNHKRKILDETEPLASEKQIHSRLHQYVLCSKIKRHHIVTFDLLNITEDEFYSPSLNEKSLIISCKLYL
jgi:hypothetical protein